MRADELKSALLAVAGVASADVAESEGSTPLVRVWLDGTRSDAEVSEDISRVLQQAGLRTSGVVDAGPPPPIEAEPTEPEPRDPEPKVESRDLHVVSTDWALSAVSVEETTEGVSVRVVTRDGREEAERVGSGPRSMDRAVVAAVARLVGVPTPEVVAVEERDVGGADVILVVLEGADGRRAAGSSVVVGGRPFAIGKASHAAVVDLA